MTNYDIDRHPLVWRDIDDIADYIGQYAGLQIAERKTYEIEHSIAQLRGFPIRDRREARSWKAFVLSARPRKPSSATRLMMSAGWSGLSA